MTAASRDYFPKKRVTPPRPGAPTMADAVWAVVLGILNPPSPQNPQTETK